MGFRKIRYGSQPQSHRHKDHSERQKTEGVSRFAILIGGPSGIVRRKIKGQRDANGGRSKHLNFLMIFREQLGFKEFEPRRRQEREVWFWVFPRSGKTISEKANGLPGGAWTRGYHFCEPGVLSERVWTAKKFEQQEHEGIEWKDVLSVKFCVLG